MLSALHLSGAELARLDSVLPPHIATVGLADNELTALPALGPARIMALNLAYNRISELPPFPLRSVATRVCVDGEV